MNKDPQFLIVLAGGRQWALDLDRVRQILRVEGIRRVPQARPEIEGLVNWQGEIVPVLRLSRRLGLPVLPLGESARIVLVQVVPAQGESRGETFVGLLVDEINSLLRVPETQVPSLQEARENPAPAAPGLWVETSVDGSRQVNLLDLQRLAVLD